MTGVIGGWMAMENNVKSLHELGVEFGMGRASKIDVAREVIRKAWRKGVSTVSLMKK
jgi:cob(I)alamin adenosyltransferase